MCSTLLCWCHKIVLQIEIYHIPFLVFHLLVSNPLAFLDLVVHNELEMNGQMEGQNERNLLLPHILNFIVSNPLAFLDLVVHNKLGTDIQTYR